MSKDKFPPGWDEARVKRLIAHYEQMDDDAMVAEDEAVQERRGKRSWWPRPSWCRQSET